MQGVHELADLAPRDVVAKAITRRMHETGHPHMWLDATHLGEAFWERRFPTILVTCRSHGVATGACLAYYYRMRFQPAAGPAPVANARDAGAIKVQLLP